MGSILEHLLTHGGIGIARMVLAVPGVILTVRTDPIEVVGMPGGTIDYANGRRVVSGPLARSSLIDYTMVWPPGADPREENLLGIFDLVRAGPAYQIIWSPGGHEKDGTPRSPQVLRMTDDDGDILIGYGKEQVSPVRMLIRLWSLKDNVDLEPDEGLRKRLGG